MLIEQSFSPAVLDCSEFHIWSHLLSDAKKTQKRTLRRSSWSGTDLASRGNLKSETTKLSDLNNNTTQKRQRSATISEGTRPVRPSLLRQRSASISESQSKPAPRQRSQSLSGADALKLKESAMHAAFVQFAAGAVGGSTATYSTHWLDTLKVKMQTFPTHYASTTRCLTHTLHNEGVRGLYQGALPAVAGQTMKAAIVFTSYGVCEELMRQIAGKSDTNDLSLCHHASAGAATGVLATFVLCPLELIKCRAQALHQLAAGTGESATVAKQMGPFKMGRAIFREEGVRGLYRGLNGMWVKEIPGSFVYFGSYEAAKSLVKEIEETNDLGTMEVFGCGLFAGLCFCVTHPIESVKTRVQVMSAHGESKGFVRSTFHILRSEGIRPLCSGIKPSMLRACSYSGIQFMAYEFAKEQFTNRDSELD